MCWIPLGVGYWILEVGRLRTWGIHHNDATIIREGFSVSNNLPLGFTDLPRGFGFDLDDNPASNVNDVRSSPRERAFGEAFGPLADVVILDILVP